jgi:phosphoglycolate phosphatase
MTNGFRLLVFDWDGTLMDSVAAIVGCMQAAARELGIEPVAEEAVRRTIGLGLADSRQAMGFDGDDALWERLVAGYRRHWAATYHERSVLFPGATETLAALGRRGYLLAVATGKSRRGLDRDLAATGLAGTFHATRTADGGCGKPHPRMLLELLAELGVGGAETLMVGDTTFDLEMAANAGTRAVAVCSGTHPRRELLEHRPLACLAGVGELASWLEAQGGTSR